jgi:hypothetical protein
MQVGNVLLTMLGVYGGTQGEQKGLGATPRFALYVVRTKSLLLALLIGLLHSLFLEFLFKSFMNLVFLGIDLM